MNNKIFKMETYRLIKSPILWLSYMGVIFFCFISCYEELKNIKDINVVYTFDYLLGLGAFKNIIIFLAPVSYISTFCNDVNNNFIRNMVIRDKVDNYSRSKFIINSIVSFLMVFLGLMTFVLILSTLMPLTKSDIQSGLEVIEPYGYLLNSNKPIAYLAIRSLLLSLSVTFWSSVGLYVASYIPNNFVTIAAPFIGCYLLGELGEFLPEIFNFRKIAYGFKIIDSNGIGNAVYSSLFFIILTIIIFKFFKINVKRRFENELV